MRDQSSMSPAPNCSAIFFAFCPPTEKNSK
jgi:hypothetical protein